jgi:hypothetical protein
MAKLKKEFKKRIQSQNFEIQQSLLKSLSFNCKLSTLTRRTLR